ncbi:MAG: ParD-like family protein [Oscillospiraceae bacterium]|jgi:hypothetical protein|nr:ParD-like family protein [Oscillospiraceae bacterium]
MPKIKSQENIKHLSVRIEDELLKKFRFVCEQENRSANGQILNFIRNFVKDFESNQGEIDVSRLNLKE